MVVYWLSQHELMHSGCLRLDCCTLFIHCHCTRAFPEFASTARLQGVCQPVIHTDDVAIAFHAVVTASHFAWLMTTDSLPPASLNQGQIYIG